MLHFVRHAEGTHNVCGKEFLKTMQVHDARLTPNGIAQCESLRQLQAGLTPELVVASPLSRTLQTAGHTFGHVLPSGSSIVALESWRETVNFHCDGRRSLSTIRAHENLLPAPVDFSQCPHDHDEIWAAYEQRHGSQEQYDGLRETADLAALAARARAAMSWLGARPETEIAIVSHAAFLRHFFAFGNEKAELGAQPQVVEFADGQVSKYMRSYFGNAECKTVVARFAP